MEDKTARTAQREDRSLRGPQSQADVSAQREDRSLRGPQSQADRAVPVELQRLDPDLPLPAYAHPGDAGADLVAAEDVDLRPGERALVRTGIAIALPPGYVGLVHPRSGLAARLGVTVLNAPGTVDAGYRGEILVNLVNLDGGSTAKIRRGDRIAQLVVQQVERAHFHVVDQLPPSRRGAEGHGSTGGHAGLAGDRSGSRSEMNGEVE